MHLNSAPFILLSLLAAPCALPAQVFPSTPFERTLDLLVTDRSFYGVWRLVDWNQDGDYNDANEAIAYYDESIGTIAMSTPTGLAVDSVGTVYVGDLGTDVITAMRDANGDGDAHDAGEHRVFFDPSNASGIAIRSPNEILVDVLDRVFVANSNNSQGGIDAIYVLEDLNGDGDAQDAGEAREYCAIPNAAGSTGHSNVFDMAIDQFGNLYYVDNGINGPIQKGVYRLTDANFDGDCNDAGEIALYWVPPSASSTPFFASLAIDQTGAMYTGDYAGDDIVWRAFDANGNGVIDPGEDSVFYQPANGLWWDINVREDGAIVLAEDQAPDRITVLIDGNGDNDALDAGEVLTAYDDTLSPNTAVRPRALAYIRAPQLFVLPTSVQVGGATNFVVRTEKPFDLGAVFLSIGLAPAFSLPPFGSVEIDATEFVAIGFGLSDANAQFTLPFGIPNLPTAAGTYGIQAWCGDDFRLFLSNASLLTVTP